MMWEVEPLENCAEINFGTRVTRKKDAGTRYPVYGGGGATFFMDEFNREDELVVARFAMSEKCTRFVEGKFFLNDSGLTLKTKNESKLRQQFLEWQCIAKNKVIYDLGRGTAQKNLNTKDFKRLSFVIPPLDEQGRIVEVLDEAFAAIDKAKANIERNLTNARELFQSRLDEKVNVLREFDAIFLKDCLAEQPRNGWSPPAKNHSDSGTPVLTLSAVTGFQFNSDKVKYTSAAVDPTKHYWVEEGDLLMTRSNTPALVGHVAIASGIETHTIYPDLIMRMRPNRSQVTSYFLYFVLRSTELRDEITSRAKGANPTMKKLNKHAVQTLVVPLPSLERQGHFVETMQQMERKCRLVEKQYRERIQILEELRQSILEQAFEGKLTELVAA